MAFIDALGFKGMWKEHDARGLLEKLRLAYTTMTLKRRPDDSFQLSITFLSDTIIIAVTINPAHATRPLAERMAALSMVADFTRLLVREMLLSDPPFAYRGAITVGEFLIEPPFIMGPAIDEAAEAERLADGAFVWFSDTALAVYQQAVGQRSPHWLLESALRFPACLYPVPMKTPEGASFQTMALVPSTTESSKAEVLERYKLAFGTSPREASKLAKTLKFVREAVDPTS